MSSPLPSLSPLEIRLLGVLVEKQRTVPDTYPLSLNALQAGCNQKTSREPVMEVGEAELAEAIDGLRGHAWLMESSGGRVSRYAHNLDKVLGLPSQSLALLTILMLRGPQTAGELRLNAERLHRFADISAVEGFLDEMSNRPAGALVMLLPRQAGAREPRWIHLLAGEPDPAMLAAGTGSAAASEPTAPTGTAARLSKLEAEVAELRQIVSELQAALGG